MAWVRFLRTSLREDNKTQVEWDEKYDLPVICVISVVDSARFDHEEVTRLAVSRRECFDGEESHVDECRLPRLGRVSVRLVPCDCRQSASRSETSEQLGPSTENFAKFGWQNHTPTE